MTDEAHRTQYGTLEIIGRYITTKDTARYLITAKKRCSREAYETCIRQGITHIF